jgi:hypothetical protein
MEDKEIKINDTVFKFVLPLELKVDKPTLKIMKSWAKLINKQKKDFLCKS